MLPFDHPLADLQAQAALASGWPTLHVLVSGEAGLLEVRARVEAVLGPLPQADEIEPWHDDPWELRVDLPGLAPEAWLRLRDAVPEAVLVPGLSPGRRLAADLGCLGFEPLEGGGLEARMAYDAAHGGLLGLDLERRGPDDAVRELEGELAAATARVGQGIAFRSERGPGTVQPIVHRSTGRFGVELLFPPDAFEGLDGDRLHRRRSALVAAVADVVHRRAGHPILRLAPDIYWDARLGFALIAWIVAPSLPALPGDAPVIGLEAVEPLGLDALAESLEVQVVPASPAAHDAVIAEVLALAPRAPVPLQGASPRWLRRPDGFAFVPTWTVPVADAAGLAALLPELQALPGVAGVRVAPSWPTGLGDVFPTIDPAWHPGRRLWFLRLRDGLSDRDRLEQVRSREPDPRDEATARAVQRAAEACASGATVLSQGPHVGRPVADSTDRPGLELVLDGGEARDERALRAALDGLAKIDLPHLAPLAILGFRSDGLRVRLWYRLDGPEPDRPRAWLGG